MNPPTKPIGAKILLVDDEPEILRAYTRLLKGLGCEVETAGNGSEAIKLLANRSFDVIISDIGMPGMRGTELLRAVRGRDLDVPIVLVTGAPDLDSAVDAVEYGAYRYLAKPVGVEILEQVVRSAYHMHALARLKRDALQIVGTEGRQLGDRASLEARFATALDKLWMAFQPIVHWPERTIFAYEALVRSDEPSLKNPMDLIDSAERLGRLHELGRRIRQRVAEAAPAAPAEALLFVNLHAVDLNDDELVSESAPLAAISQRVVLEITERASLDGVSGVAAKVAALRQRGYRIAVDDLGAGYAGLSTFSQLAPEFAKLDMSLVRGVDQSTSKRSVIRAMARLCTRDLGIQVVCEGIETSHERDALESEGCSLLQGYLFARPERGFPPPKF